jgi:hypothetical protein
MGLLEQIKAALYDYDSDGDADDTIQTIKQIVRVFSPTKEEWLFCAFKNDDTWSEDFPTEMFITSKAYWDKHHCASDHHISDDVEHMLPQGFSEEAESLFFGEYDVETTREKMLAAGFIEDEEFTKFINRN